MIIYKFAPHKVQLPHAALLSLLSNFRLTFTTYIVNYAVRQKLEEMRMNFQAMLCK